MSISWRMPSSTCWASWTCWTWPSRTTVLRAAYVRQAAWPASTLLAGFKAFFTLVLLQQLFASLRQGKLLAETITDFWSPHEPIHERARNALPQYGALAIGPLLLSLRSVPSLTKEQRDQLPLILATIGPSTIPALLRHLHDPHEHVRAIAAAALGHLHALDTVPLLVALARTPATWCGRAWSKRWASSAARGTQTRPHEARPRPGRGSRVRGLGVVVRAEEARRAGAARATRSSWPWRPWSPPWPTTRRRCGPRPPWRWAGSGRPPRRWPPG